MGFYGILSRRETKGALTLMSEEDQIIAIGRAVQAASECNKIRVALEAELERASESFKIAHVSLREILQGGDIRQGHDIFKALKALTDPHKVREMVQELAKVRAKHIELDARVRQVTGR